jgi:hypothetical protein
MFLESCSQHRSTPSWSSFISFAEKRVKNTPTTQQRHDTVLVVPDLDLKSELSKEFGLGDREERQENIAISRERTKRFSSLSGN